MRDAAKIIAEIRAAADPDDIDYVARFYAGDLPGNRIMGTRMPKVFPIAKRHGFLPLSEVQVLLDDAHYEVRMAAITILDTKARSKRLPVEDRRAVLDIYLQGLHRQIDTWDFVDRAASFVVGEPLATGLVPFSILEGLIAHDRPMGRRTAIVATHAFLKRKDTRPTFTAIRALASDPHPYVQKAIGSWAREAGKQNPNGLSAFLKEVGSALPPQTVKAATRT